jgi:hypothetical protein
MDILSIRIKHAFLLLLGATISYTVVVGQTKIIAPVERGGFSHVTSYDSLQEYLKLIASSPGMQVEQIATSRLGRMVKAVKISADARFGSDTTKLRVLLFAQQHGDEPSGKEALTLLIAKFASLRKSHLTNRLDILIVPQMNPDGSELRQRRTSDSMDLNRNHVLLTSPETKGLHDLFEKWMPEITLDMHEFTSGKEWSDSGMIKTADIQLGMLTHPSTPERIRNVQHQGVYPFIASELKRQGYRFQEYIVGSPDSRIRHSTTEINDGRQSFGILNTMSFIQEGRKWYGLEDTLRRRTESQLASVEALLEYCAQHADEIHLMVSNERSRLSNTAGTNIVLRLEHGFGTIQSVIPVLNLRSKKDTVWTIAPYHSVVQPHLIAKIPYAYAVPKQLTGVLELLKRHHVKVENVSTERSVQAEVCTLDSIGTEIVEEDPKPRPYVHWNKTAISLHPGDMIIKTNQLQSLFVTIVLEPESVWGLMGYNSFDAVLHTPGVYPIYRIEQ